MRKYISIDFHKIREYNWKQTKNLCRTEMKHSYTAVFTKKDRNVYVMFPKMNSVPKEILEKYDCDSFIYIGKSGDKEIFKLYNKSDDMYEEGEFTGFPCLISFDGNIFSEIKDGKEFIKALKLLKNKK